MRRKLKGKEQGITLVALVVTIVVLLILAGITIVYVFGDNGVFGKALDAKLKTDVASWQERLEVAKGPIFIEGLGTFDPDAYFQYIQDQGIINDKDKDVIDNGDGTYDVTTKPGYVFLVTLIPSKENPTDAEIEYLGEVGKLQPKIKRIIVTGKTKTSIDIRVSARLEGGEVKCYYKKASEVASGEAENSIEGYTEVTLDENLAGSITGLTAGESYKIKAVLRKDEEEIGWVSIEEKTVPLITVTSITLDKKTAKVAEDETLQLIATVKPDNAEDKSVTWSSSNTSIATVDQTGKITGVAIGTASITVTANDGSGVTASCEVTVVDLWEWMDRVAKAITNDDSINSGSRKATGTTEANEEYSIEVGDIFYVKYNGEKRRVRVLGFKHDDLVNQGIYKDGKQHEKAGISFEFYDFMTGTTYMPMNTSSTIAGGWVSTKLRTDLNGTGSSIGGLGANLSNKSYIKQVKKIYNSIDTASSTSSTSNDYLWLLSCSEIWTSGAESSYSYGYSKAKEGDQYQYYKGVVTGTGSNTNLVKKSSESGGAGYWWLRSPWQGAGTASFCDVAAYGSADFFNMMNSQAVAPGFSI